MNIVRMREAVILADQEATDARLALRTDRDALLDSAKKHWLPRAWVGSGALLGYWLEGHMNPRATAPQPGSDSTSREQGSRNAGTGPSANGLAGWLALSLSTLRLIDLARPLFEQIMAERDRPRTPADETSSQASAASPDRGRDQP